MEIFISVLLLAVGIFLIVKGGDFFVDSASWIAEVSGIPPLIVGATIVSVATTLPELLVSIMATVQGSVDIAVGNAVGSVVANTGLIMAISLIFLPSVIKRKDYAFKSILLVFTVGLLWLCCIKGEISAYLGIIVFLCFILFVFENVRSAIKKTRAEKANVCTCMLDTKTTFSIPAKTPMLDTERVFSLSTTENAEPIKKDKKTIIINIAKFILGAAGIVIGADLLVEHGQNLARLAHIPEGVIAITLVAIGTSLPELVTTVTAIVKKKSSLSVGNIIGANILDMSMIMPICAFVSGGSLVVPQEALSLDIPFCFALSVIAVIPTLFTKKFSRYQGFLLLIGYAAYLTLRIILTA